MVDNIKKYIIRTELDTKGVVKQYDDMMRKMAAIDRKYSSNRGGRGGGSRGSPSGSRRGGSFQDTQRFHNMNAGMGDLLSQLSSMPKVGIHKDLVGQIGMVQSRIAGLRNQLSRVSSGRELANLTIKYREARTEAMALLRANQKYNKSLGITNTLTNKFVGSLKHAGLAAVSVYGIARLGGIIFEVGKDMDAMRASLLAASKDAAEAPKNFEFLRQTSFELGKDIQTMTGGFNRLGVAARAAGLDTDQIKEIFLAASEASTTFALDNQRTGLVMLAMSQILSKGRVSMEEMSRQMGENLPIAMEAGARSMGLTQAEFIKMVESGKVLSKDFMLPFARQLRIMVRENDALAKATDKLTAKQQRLTTAFKDLIDQTFQGGFAKSIGRLFDWATRFVKFITPAFKSIFIAGGEIVEILVEATAALVGFIAAIPLLKDLGSGVSRVWLGVKAVFHDIAAVVWNLIGAVQYLTALLNKEVSLPGLKESASAASSFLTNTKIPSLTPSYFASLLAPSSGGITVQGDIKVQHDGSQNVVDEIITQLGFQ